MFICEICGTRFDEPVALTRKERMPDGFSENVWEVVCPVCNMGEQYFHKEEDEE